MIGEKSRVSRYKGKLTDYILREDAISALCKTTCYRGMLCPDEYCKEVREPFDEIPAADVVQVIRCQDCKYGEFPPHNVRCTLFYGMGGPNQFCSYAELRDDSNE